jgi:hypothetical protein
MANVRNYQYYIEKKGYFIISFLPPCKDITLLLKCLFTQLCQKLNIRCSHIIINYERIIFRPAIFPECSITFFGTGYRSLVRAVSFVNIRLDFVTFRNWLLKLSMMVVGVNQPPDLAWKFKHSGESAPVLES